PESAIACGESLVGPGKAAKFGDSFAYTACNGKGSHADWVTSASDITKTSVRLHRIAMDFAEGNINDSP
ncbi:unnamed protein product, partial [Strongylus vulgaris]